MTPTLTAARQKYPAAEIWVVVRRGCEGILAGCPAIDRVLTAAPAEQWNRGLASLGAEVRLILALRRRGFDCVFELGDSSRGRWLAWLSGGRRAAADGSLRPLGRWWQRKFTLLALPPVERKKLHRVQKDFAVASQLLALGEEAPPLSFVPQRTQEWSGVDGGAPFVVFHPGTRWLRKRWPIARWVELGSRLVALGFRIVISAGPDADEVALGRELVAGIGAGTVSTMGQANWPQLAGLLHRASLFVGVDTAAMHLAAACQCPTVALFGPSVATYWRPWQVPHELVSPPLAFLETLPRLPPEQRERENARLMEQIQVAGVFAACERVLAGTGARPWAQASGLRAST